MTPSTWRKLWLGVFVVAWLATAVLFFLAGEWLWGSLWLIILVPVLVSEIKAMLTPPRQTISTRFGRMLQTKPVLGWVIVWLMGLSWVSLLGHLVWR